MSYINYTRTNIFGDPWFTITCLAHECTNASFIFLSAESEKRKECMPFQGDIQGFPIYGFENEIIWFRTASCFWDSPSNSFVKDFGLFYVKRLISELEDTFDRYEKFYAAPIYLTGIHYDRLSNQEVISILKSEFPEENTIYYHIYKKVKAIPLTLDDVIKCRELFKNPTGEGQLFNPFEIERRKMLFKELALNTNRWPLSSYCISKLFDQDEDTTEKDLMKLCNDVEMFPDKNKIKKIFKNTNFKQLLKYANTLKNDPNWVDPFQLIVNEKAYSWLL